MRSQYRALH